ncbi:MAG TPA: response regulator [Verrucomicrobiae bacterium]|nr:response regulator [Verrucomicrobiae bacterium]
MPDKPHLNRRILVIDDNRAIHEDFKKILCSTTVDATGLAATEAALFDEAPVQADASMFELEHAFQGQEALAMVIKAVVEKRPYAMAFVDVRMPPGWDGIETIARIWEEYPDLQVVVCTAYSDYSLEDILKKLGESDQLVILKKPFDNIEVLQLAHAMTEKWRLIQTTRAHTENLEQRVQARTQELQNANEKLKFEISERNRVEEALRQSQKMEAVGQLAGGVAHDFNNLLTVIQGYVACLLRDGKADATSQQALQQIGEAAERAANLTRQLLTFSRKQVMQPEGLDINEAINHVGKLLHRVLGEDIALQLETGVNLPGICADRSMIEQVLLNLAVNARDAMPKGGQLLIRTSGVVFTPEDVEREPKLRAGRFVCISVTDTGCGIAPEILPRIFEPFFTTKAVGKGTGLGLATVYGIVKQHDGWIEVHSVQGNGSTFCVFLPGSEKPTASFVSKGGSGKSIGGDEMILLVEDESALRLLAKKILERYGYHVLTANSGVDALKVWATQSNEIKLLLTDMVMPEGMSGSDLAKRLLVDKPGLKVIYSSGYSLELISREGVLREGINFLPKPYSPERLAGMVRTCLDEAFATAQPEKFTSGIIQ